MGKQIDIDERLLKEILSIETYHDDDDDMLRAIQAKIEEIAAEQGIVISVRQDEYGNLYAVKLTSGAGTDFYPCVISHTDTVHERGQNLTVRDENGTLRGWNNVENR